jgi:uridine monophosphate synthetase
MSGFFARLEERARAAGSLLCVGLDPRAADASEARSRSLALIDSTARFAAAFKANAAFFEAHGPAGLEALIEIVASVPDEIPVILDAKRADIASTAAAYAAACFDVVGAGAVTVNPYLGRDGVDPFLAHHDRGVFVLCRTSNPSASDVQDLDVGGSTVAERVARLAASWAGPDRLGLVVGATAPASLAAVRKVVPEHWVLAPGVGAQGAGVEAAAAAMRDDRLGVLVPVSRAIASAADPAAAARELRDRLAAINPGPAARPTALSTDLHAAGCVRFGEFTLRSGAVSPVYVDLRRLVGHPQVLRRVAEAYAGVLGGIACERIGAVPYGALPLATAVSLATGVPLVWPRPEVKGHGTGSRVEGEWEEGERVVLIDDVVTSGGSAVEAAATLRAVGLVVEDLVVLLDRSPSTLPALSGAGLRLHSITTMRSLVDDLESAGAIDAVQHRSVVSFLETA